MDYVNLEKILYVANKYGSYGISSRELHNKESSMTLIYEMCHVLKYLTWKTNDGPTDGSYYTIHFYEITPRGRVRLALLKLSYAFKKEPNKVEERYRIVINSLKNSYTNIEDFSSELTKAELKAFNTSHDQYQISEPSLIELFEFSKQIGNKQSTGHRSDDYVFKKSSEELGELSVEIQVDQGLTYKTAGPDGIAGEAVDLAICAMDMFALQYPNLSAADIEKEFLLYMQKKLNKWKKSI